jgi:hypothetical protein
MKKLSLKHAMGEILAHDITEVNPQQGCKGVAFRRIHPRGRHYKLVVEASSKQYLDIDTPAHAFRVMGLQQGQTLNISLKSQGLVGCRNNPYLHTEET